MVQELADDGVAVGIGRLERCHLDRDRAAPVRQRDRVPATATAREPFELQRLDGVAGPSDREADRPTGGVRALEGDRWTLLCTGRCGEAQKEKQDGKQRGERRQQAHRVAPRVGWGAASADPWTDVHVYYWCVAPPRRERPGRDAPRWSGATSQL